MLQRVEIRPLAGENGPVYVGRVGSVELRFRNESRDAAVTVFTEPPLEVRGPDGRLCRFDGGNWPRDGVFATSNGRTLATLEYSGGWQALRLRDTRSCRRVGEIDLSDAGAWRIDGDRVVVGDAPHARTLRLDDRCRVDSRGGERRPR